ncbi:MAG: hypothetical protein DWQ04_15175 [Chloroflexi bacterium]|nr:MAG: hypothetical protein DWQ04_15175 [Chloroflexota bacterium]
MKKGGPKQTLTRYALTGGAIGLYFGLFFRPLREADYAYALMLALVATVVMTMLHVWQKRPSWTTVPRQFAVTFVKVALALTVLEGRHLAYDWGGKTAVIVFTFIMGTATGLWFAYDQSRQHKQSEEKQA